MFHMLALLTSHATGSDVNKTLFSALSDKQTRSKLGIRSMSDLQPEEQLWRLRSYVKVIVARHPVVRVLSFFADKLRRRHNGKCVTFYQNDIGRRAIKWRRGVLTSRDFECADSLQFDEFIAYFASHLSTLGSERHLTPISDWCLPCHVSYDYVMKLETGARDQLHLLRDVIDASLSRLTDPNNVIAHRNSHLMTSQHRFERSNFSLVFGEFENVTSDSMTSLVEFFSRDLQLFGYSASLEATRGLRAECMTSERSNTVKEAARCC